MTSFSDLVEKGAKIGVAVAGGKWVSLAQIAAKDIETAYGDWSKRHGAVIARAEAKVREALQSEVTEEQAATAAALLSSLRPNARIKADQLVRAFEADDSGTALAREVFGGALKDQDEGVLRTVGLVMHETFQTVWFDPANDAALTKEMSAAVLKVQRALMWRIDRLAAELKLSNEERQRLESEAERAQKELGSTNSLILGFLENIRRKKVAPDQIPAELFRATSEWDQALRRVSALDAPRNVSPRLHELKAKVQEALDREDAETAWVTLSEIEAEEDRAFERLEAERREIEQGLEVRRQGRLDAKAAKLPLARARLDLPQCVSLVIELASLSARDADDRVVRLWAEQEAWLVSGRDQGLAFDLEVSIALARALLRDAKGREQRRFALIKLGAALHEIGQREAGSERLVEAGHVHRAALKELTRKDQPHDWATVQNNLGNVLQALGKRQNGIKQLAQAAASYRRALDRWTPEQQPLDWAKAQNNLGNALLALAQRDGLAKRLLGAVSAYRAALTVLRQETDRVEWAAAQQNLGSALGAMAEQEPGTGREQEAAEAFRLALTERSRERFPLQWAQTMSNLARLEIALARTSGDSAHLDEAKRLALAAREVFAEAQAEANISNVNQHLAYIAALRSTS